MGEYPEISRELLEYLQRQFPDRAVDPDVNNPHRAYGQQEVIRHLEFVFNQGE